MWAFVQDVVLLTEPVNLLRVSKIGAKLSYHVLLQGCMWGRGGDVLSLDSGSSVLLDV